MAMFSLLENDLVPYRDIKDDYMTFFAFHGVLLGAFLGVLGYNEFFSFQPGPPPFSYSIDLAKLGQQWENTNLWADLLMIMLLIFPVLSIWFTLVRLLKVLMGTPESKSYSLFVFSLRAASCVMIYATGTCACLYLALGLNSIKGALFTFIYFGINLFVLSWVILSNLWPIWRNN